MLRQVCENGLHDQRGAHASHGPHAPHGTHGPHLAHGQPGPGATGETRRDVTNLLTPLYQAIGGRLYRLHILQLASAIMMGDGMDLESRLVMMQREISRNTTTRFVGSIEERDELRGLAPGDICHVADASADPLIVEGSAGYIWLPDLCWKLIWRGNSPLSLENFIAPGCGIGLDKLGRLIALPGDLLAPEGGLGLDDSGLLLVRPGDFLDPAGALASGKDGLAIDLDALLAGDLPSLLAELLAADNGGLVARLGRLELDVSAMEAGLFAKLLKNLHLPTWLEDNLDLYVDGSQEENGDGSQASPFNSLQAACDHVVNEISLGSFSVTIHVAPGIYAGPVFLREYRHSGGAVSITGEDGVTLERGTVTGFPEADYIIVGHGGDWYLNNLTLDFTVSQMPTHSLTAVTSEDDCSILLSNCTANLVQAVADSKQIAAFRAFEGGEIYLSECAISATVSQGSTSAMSALESRSGGYIGLNGPVTINGAYSIVAYSAEMGNIGTATQPTGTATGTRYAAAHGSGISTWGGGPNYFPGSTAGTVDDTSWYM